MTEQQNGCLGKLLLSRPPRPLRGSIAFLTEDRAKTVQPSTHYPLWESPGCANPKGRNPALLDSAWKL
jgi:hypothetical protein